MFNCSFNKYLVPVVVLALSLTSCVKDSDAHREPLIKSDIKPLPVSDVTVKNLNGAAIISYKLPNDTSVLYVQADYMINEKLSQQEKVSKYSSEIKVNGFGKVTPYKVILYAVSQSEVKSDPVEVTVNPQTPPYLAVRSSLVLQDAFGGVDVSYQNQDTASVGIVVLTKKNNRDEYVYAEYTNKLQGNFTLRGFDTNPRTFGAYVIDRWGNMSDTVWKTINPLFESQLDKNKIANGNLPKDAVAGWGTAFGNLFNHTGAGNGSASQTYGAATTAGAKPMITFYLGQPTKLSRIKFWAANNEYYKNIAPRVFQIWVSNNPSASGDLDNSWTQIGGNYEITKPSGQPVGSNTALDDQTAAAGWEFAFPLPPIQCNYLRIVGVHTWGVDNDTRIRLSSILFWGDTR